MKKLFFASVVVACGISTSYADFSSPSGNIVCGASGNGVLCHIGEADNLKPLRPIPKDCPTDWENWFYIGRSGSANHVCKGDWDFGNPTPLNFGSSTTINGITCTSQSTGMTCKNKQGHGFSVGKQNQKFF